MIQGFINLKVSVSGPGRAVTPFRLLVLSKFIDGPVGQTLDIYLFAGANFFFNNPFERFIYSEAILCRWGLSNPVWLRL